MSRLSVLYVRFVMLFVSLYLNFSLETKIYQKDTDALTILGLLYFYGVGLEMDKPKGKKMINEAVQKGNTAASWIIKDIYKNTN